MKSKKTPSKIDSVAFLVLRPVSQLEFDRWGIEYLNRLNINTFILDLTYLLNNEDAACEVVKSVDKPIQNKNLYVVRSYEQLECLIKKLRQDTLFIDYISAVSPITIKTARVFRVLKKCKAAYGFISDGALPVGTTEVLSNLSSIRRTSYLIKESFKNPKRLINFLTNQIIKVLVRYRLVFPVPRVIFGGNSPVLERFIIDRALPKNIVVPINSHDFSVYKEYLDRVDGVPADSSGTCVFLDEALTHHSDFAILGIESANAEIYYRDMNSLFSRIERETKLEVVIAAHPRSRYDEGLNPFDGRKIIKGRTVDLVAESQLVVMHMSTSVSYAILFEKPVIVVRIPGVSQDSVLNIQVKTMAESIGSIEIDFGEYISKNIPATRDIDKNKYEEYKERYLVNKNAENYSTSNIVASKIQEIDVESNLI